MPKHSSRQVASQEEDEKESRSKYSYRQVPQQDADEKHSARANSARHSGRKLSGRGTNELTLSSTLTRTATEGMMGTQLTMAANAALGGGGEEWFIAASAANHIDTSTVSRVFMWWVLLHFVAGCVYIGRAVSFETDDENPNRLLRMFPSMCFAGAHFMIGVLMPMWSHQVAHSKEVVCIMAHRTQYENLQSTGFRYYMTAAKYLGPLSNLLALVGPAHASLEMWNHNSYDSFLLGVFVCACIGMAGMLVFTSGKCGDVVVDACSVAVKGLISEIENESYISDCYQHDWDLISKHFYYLSVALSNVWEWDRVGGLFLIRIVVLFFASFALGVYSLSEHNLIWRNLFILVGVLLACCGLGLMFQLAAITSLCQNRRPGCNSVSAKAQRYLLCDEAQDGALSESFGKRRISVEIRSLHEVSMDIKSKHQLSQMAGNSAGVHILGIVFTYSLVLRVARTMVVYLPLALSVTGHLLHQEKIEDGSDWELST